MAWTADQKERFLEHANPARRLYERLGFIAVDDGEESPIYIRMDRPPASAS